MFYTKDLELAPDWLSFHVRICILLYCIFVLCWIALCVYLAKWISCYEQFLKTQAIRTEWRMTVNTLAYLKLYHMILRKISLNH